MVKVIIAGPVAWLRTFERFISIEITAFILCRVTKQQFLGLKK